MNHYELDKYRRTPYLCATNNILILYNKEMTTLLWYPEGKADGTCRVPSTVTAIGEYASATTGYGDNSNSWSRKAAYKICLLSLAFRLIFFDCPLKKTRVLPPFLDVM